MKSPHTQSDLLEFISNDRRRGWLLKLCYRLLGNGDDAEDALQEALMRIVRAAAVTYDGSSAPSTYAHAAVYYTCLQFRRKKNRRRTVSLLADPLSREMGVPRQAALRELSSAALTAIDSLPDKQQSVILGRAGGGTLQECGDRLGVTRERARQLEAMAQPAVWSSMRSALAAKGGAA